jgi:hypothetical protein
MNLNYFIDHVRSSPTDLVLYKTLDFTLPHDFNEFLQVLKSSETIRYIQCGSPLRLGISEDYWVLLIKTFGSIKGIKHLRFEQLHGSPEFHPLRAVAEAIKRAQSLCSLKIGLFGSSTYRDSSGMFALANALREHTALQDFNWYDHCSLLQATHIPSLDPVLHALSACPHLQKVIIKTEHASANAIKKLLQLSPAAELRLALLKKEDWFAVANEIRQGRCNVRKLTLAMRKVTRSDATEAVKAVASAIRLDRNLEHLQLQMQNGFTDEAGVALAEALTVNTTLRKICYGHNKVTLGAPSYEAFAAMLRVNTNLVLNLPRLDTVACDETLVNHYNQMRIEQRLNKVGRGRLLAPSNHTRTEEWVDALHKLSACAENDDPSFDVSCLYSLLRLNPAVVA